MNHGFIPAEGGITLSDKYKYSLGTMVTVSRELTVYGTDDAGKAVEVVIPAGQSGVINSCGRDSRYGYHRQLYYVTFSSDDNEEEVMFFLEDLENECEVFSDGEVDRQAVTKE